MSGTAFATGTPRRSGFSLIPSAVLVYVLTSSAIKSYDQSGTLLETFGPAEGRSGVSGSMAKMGVSTSRWRNEPNLRSSMRSQSHTK